MLLSIAATCLLALAPQNEVPFREGKIVTRVSQGGRIPILRDTVADEFVGTGQLKLNSDWKDANANQEGWFTGINGGYLQTVYNAPAAAIMILEATGHSMVYVNGEPRGGDPYSYGYLRLPVKLKAGENQFVFGGGRGRVRAKLVSPRSAAQLDTSDVTLPDFLEGESAPLFGGIVLVNASEQEIDDLVLRTTAEGRMTTRRAPSVAPLTTRKVRFDFAQPKADPKIKVELLRAGKVLDTVTIEGRLRKKTEAYKRTFVSKIDGSVQYYGVTPALKPSKSNGLVLTLHGASVEGIGQAQAYAPKDDMWIVAPTNRRPYGFDWEDWGRMDAMEVLDLAQKNLPHDPKKVYLTGHSMGGHGTWAIGSMFPDRFAAIAPSAGWVSFWSYGGGWNPNDATGPEQVLRSSMNVYDTLMRGRNLGNLAVYILHGDADDNVPVGQARTMREYLKDWHPNFKYHEQPGAGHWWGNECVDWPAIFDLFRSTQRTVGTGVPFAFLTPAPSVSANYGSIEVRSLKNPAQPASILSQGSLNLLTENVRSISFENDPQTVSLNMRRFSELKPGTVFQNNAIWTVRRGSQDLPGRGLYKETYQNGMVFVYGTAGSAEENAWAFAKARYDAEQWYYRGNGAVDLVSDATAVRKQFKGRNLVLYGNADTNAMWNVALKNSPVQVMRSRVQVGTRRLDGSQGAIFHHLRSDGPGLVATVSGTDLPSLRVTDRLPVFVSGVAYPDWVLFAPDAAARGTKGVTAAGWYGEGWNPDSGQAEWLP